MKKILITKKLPFDVDKEFGDYDLIYNNTEKSLSYNDLKELVKNADGLISMLSDNIDKEIIECADKLKVIANYAVGYNNIDINVARDKGIAVFNTPYVLTETTAELGFALMISVARRIVEADTFTRSGAFEGWQPSLFLGMDLYGKTLGIYGFGRIGQVVARCASGFNMQIQYCNPSKKFNEELILNARQVDFETLLRTSDFIIVTAPLNSETRHKFGINEFRKMKKSAVFVNIGRGQIVKENDLVLALKNNEIFGAGLDVYEFEPEINSELYSLDNAIILPHIGSASKQTRANMAKLCIDSVKNILENKNKETFNRIC
jgi:lactate dehydrogenase-like 2-hydroxyacid dehydrogenase